MRVPNVLLVPAVCLLAASSGMAAAMPSIRHGTIHNRSAATGLEPLIREIIRDQRGPAWIGYAVPLRPGHSICCSGRGSGCRCPLEREQGISHQFDEPDSLDLTVKRHLLVLSRVAKGEVQRIRCYSDECELDAGGLPLFWLSDVAPDQSIAWLASFVTGPSGQSRWNEDIADRVVSGIALHDDPGALDMLCRLVEPARPDKLRVRPVFWIGETGGRRGVELLDRILRDDPSRKVREQAVFALTLSNTPEALETLIRVARTDRDPDIRSRAVFWLGNEAGEKAAATIADMAVDDPDTDVKERAVFALSQLPPDVGVPRLIHVARTNSNPEVRKQAIFWLTQSEDPRALDFFEEILAH
ncbi:MAG: HEAT repeat domain-containing protein [Candidatus Zixiibacteriota bacterium]